MLILVVAPTVEPVTLEEVKEHLRVTHDEQDALIEAYISAAREAIELETGRALAAGTYRWVSEGAIGLTTRLPLWPVDTVTEITYENDRRERVPFTDYILDSDFGTVNMTYAFGRSLSVTFTTVAMPIPPALRAALFLLVTDLYEQGGGVITGVSVADNPTVSRLVYPHRINLGV